MMVKELKDALYFVCTLEFWWMAVSWNFSLLFSYLKLFAKTLFSRNPISYPRCSPSPLPPPLSKTASSEERRPICIITGATSGLGAAAAYSLSLEGFFVVLVGRSSYLLSKVMEDLKKRNKHANVKCFQVDLSSFHSILKFKDSFQQWLLGSDLHSSLQLLINNAGILATSFRPTAEGFDQVMATNYIGAFSLTKVLLPLLENSPVPSRIVNVTSFTHRAVSDIQVDKETVSGKPFSKFKTYPYAHAYAYSKLFLLLFSYELHRQFDIMGKSRQVSVIAVDPGAVKTNIMRELPTCISYVALLVLKLVGLLQSPENGVRCILDAALAPPEISGVYFFGGNGRTVNSSALSYNTKFGKKLWATSCDLFRELQLTSKDTSF
ncbi:Dehydrogenase/reductase SDR family member on chromosome X like [Actinidia chinensis var. chinensis]|uniref:Dehydrogenase/reductase SDR family member on chromosome X like n=1 Tax=Actinidia chinensis var. chinensis TaxID=1590841 RepID=A0A2R6PMA3_ACTCC|nr:Dehydrogenase/reductase SDR family member on chromosome X like [Actinidia chinensis var. chinensis]